MYYHNISYFSNNKNMILILLIKRIVSTNFPIEFRKNRSESSHIFFVNDMLVTVSGNARLTIAWRRPYGAISITIASLGMYLSDSSNNTLFNKLFV